jgi:protein-S-isoprenylcysteine O-methyltransferase Ste14
MDQQAPVFARIAPPVWALFYTLIAWGISAAASLLPLASLPQPVLGWVLIIAGVVVATSGAVTFRRAKTQVRPDSETNARLITHGPFRYTRNPMYLGLTFVTLGIAFLVGTLPFFAVPLLVLITNNSITIPYEEAKMERQFGEAFHAYKQKTRRWL